MNEKIYIIDACALIDAAKNYPIDKNMFSGIWEKIGQLFENGKLFSSAEIFEEIKDKDLSEWLKKYKKNFLPLDEEIQQRTKEVLQKFPKLININKNNKSTSNGDPFLIATAIKLDGVIVTNEGNGENKIPYVSKEFNVATMRLEKFVREIID